jgi:general secretion pathway protein L
VNSSASTNFQKSIDEFIKWWLAELKMLMPASVCNWFQVRRGNVVIEMGKTQLTVSRFEDQEGVKVEREIISFDDELDPNLMGDRILHGFDVKRTRIVLRLASNQVLRKQVTVPIALEENLKEAISFDIDRYTPFKPEQIYCDLKILNRHEADSRLDVLIAVIAKKNVTKLQREIERYGLELDTIEMAGTRMDNIEGAENFHPQFVSENDSAKKKKSSNKPLNTAIVVAGLLCFSILVYPLAHQMLLINTLSESISETKSDAKLAVATRKELDKIVGGANFLVAKKQQTSRTLAVLNELTQILPDDSYVHLFELTGRKLRIQGQSSAASNLIRLIENSTLFTGAKFNSPLTKDRKTGLQRFYLTAEVIKKDYSK